MSDSAFRLGEHSAQIEGLDGRIGRVESTVSRMEGKLDTALEALAERRGERRMVALVATAAGGVGSFLMTLVFKFMERP